VHSSKKKWAKPAVARLELARARALIVRAIEALGENCPDSDELQSVLEDIDTELAKH
jgi:hypothetical protein